MPLIQRQDRRRLVASELFTQRLQSKGLRVLALLREPAEKVLFPFPVANELSSSGLQFYHTQHGKGKV